MPANVLGLTDASLEIFSGLQSEMRAADLPPGVSPACQDVAFIPGAVFTRGGLVSIFTPLSGNPTVNYLDTYSLPNGLNKWLLVLDALGNLWAEETPGTLTSISSGVIAPNCYAQSVSAFGRGYIDFSDGNFGLDIPRQLDSQGRLDRVSQVGPGAAPTSVSDIVITINTLNRVANVTTVATVQPHGLKVGQLAQISGASDASFNGTYPVASVIDANHFTYWNAVTAYSIQNLTLAANVVTITLTQPFATARQVIVNGSDVADGLFTVTVLSSTQIQYNFTAQNNSSSVGTVYYLNLPGAPIGINFTNTFTQTGSGLTLASVTLVSPPPAGQTLTIGQRVTITGTGNPAIDGVQTVAFDNFFTSNGVFSFYTTAAPGLHIVGGTFGNGLPDKGPITGGLAAGSGNIDVGEHQIVVSFLTEQSYITAPSPIIKWSALGGFKAQIMGLPIGPPNVTARILSFTGANGGNFFYIGNPPTGFVSTTTIVPDNTSTSVVVDFSDAELLSSTPIDQPGGNLFALEELGESLGCIEFESRMFHWGERNKVFNFTNLTFDGGYNATNPNIPLGWSVPAGTVGTVHLATTPSIWGFSYAVSRTISAPTGQLTQSAYRDSFGQPILQSNTAYSVRARLYTSGINFNSMGILDVTISSASTAFSVTASLQSSTTFTWEEVILPIGTMPAVIPSDLTLTIAVDFSTYTGNANTLYADNIEIFPTAIPYLTTQVRASYVEDPESFDGETGLIDLSAFNGQAVKSAFILRDNLYFVKESSLYVVTPSATGEPATWSVNEVSQKVGTLSVHGVDVGEQWAVIAGREGLYIYFGGEPQKISQEIDPNWQAINWDAGQNIWTKIDKRNRRILVGVPISPATVPNVILSLDYKELPPGEAMAADSPIHTSYSGKLIAMELQSRKWCPWNINANCCTTSDRPDGTSQVFFGNSVGNGKVYEQRDSATNDDGAAIDSFWTSYFFLSPEQEQMLQIGSVRKLWGYLTAYVEGSGTLFLTAFINSLQNSWGINPVPLRSPMFNDMEIPLNITGARRVAFRFETKNLNDWFRLQKVDPFVKADPWSPVAGVF